MKTFKDLGKITKEDRVFKQKLVKRVFTFNKLNQKQGEKVFKLAMIWLAENDWDMKGIKPNQRLPIIAAVLREKAKSQFKTWIAKAKGVEVSEKVEKKEEKEVEKLQKPRAKKVVLQVNPTANDRMIYENLKITLREEEFTPELRKDLAQKAVEFLKHFEWDVNDNGHDIIGISKLLHVVSAVNRQVALVNDSTEQDNSSEDAWFDWIEDAKKSISISEVCEEVLPVKEELPLKEITATMNQLTNEISDMKQSVSELEEFARRMRKGLKHMIKKLVYKVLRDEKLLRR